MQVSPEALREVEEALDRYKRLVDEHSTLRSDTKKTYLLHASNFARWLKGESEPGAPA